MRKSHVGAVLDWIKRGQSQPSLRITRRPQDIIPSFYDKVPVRFVENILASLCGFGDPHAVTPFTERKHGIRPGDSRPMLCDIRYSFIEHYFAEHTLCLRLKVDIFGSHIAPTSTTSVVILRMNRDGCVPQWLDQCIALDAFELSGDLPPDVFLGGPTFEIALRCVYLSERTEPHHIRHYKQHTDEDRQLQVAGFVKDNNLTCVCPSI